MVGIDYEGPWSEEEKRMVREAVERVEVNMGLRVPESMRREAWTCTRDEDRSRFSVSRFDFEDVAEAGSLVRLIHQLEVLSITPEPEDSGKAFVALPEHIFRSAIGAPASLPAAHR